MSLLTWLDCPYSKVGDPYPGLCELYTDTNSNQICDHSEPASELLNFGRIAGSSISIFWPVLLPLVVYLVYWFLTFKVKRKEKGVWLNPIAFRYFWNLVLLALFLLTAITSLILLFGTSSSSLAFWHNQIGVALVVIALLHLLFRVKYYLKPPKKT